MPTTTDANATAKHDLKLSPDLEAASRPPPLQSKRWWLDEIDTTHTDLALLACCFTTGLIDSAVFKNYSAFVGMQTGNTVILCLSSAGFPLGQPWAWAITLLSLVSFFLGAFTTTRACAFLGAHRRLVVVANFAFQAVCILLAAALAVADVLVSDNLDGDPAAVLRSPRILIPIAPLAFQSGATIAASRQLGYGNEIPVTVYTSTYAALAADPNLFRIHGNAPRNRRVAALLCAVSGAMVATWIEARSVGIKAIFWIAGGTKVLLTVGIAAFIPLKTLQLEKV